MIDRILDKIIKAGWLAPYRDLHKVHFLLGACFGLTSIIWVYFTPIALGFPAVYELYQYFRKGQRLEITIGDLIVRYLGTMTPLVMFLGGQKLF